MRFVFELTEVLAASADQVSLPTAVVHAPVAVPAALWWTLMVMAIGVVASGGLDAAAWWRLRPRRPPAPRATGR